MISVSIVIPAYNAEKTLDACLRGCLHQTHAPCEVVVVDDGSNDRTEEVVRAFPAVRYLRQPNRGPAAARNFGARAACGAVLVFTDADCVPAQDWVARLLAGFGPGVGAVGGAYGIANPQSLLARLVHQEIVCRHARFGDAVDFLGSFNMACRREDFEAAGGFDERFRAASGEDNDFSYRLLDRGSILRFAPDAVVAHHHPERWWPYLRTQSRHGFWRVKLYQKHPHRAAWGDRYAGWPDLAAPVCALAAVLSLPAVAALTMAGEGAGWLWALWGGSALPALLLHLPMTLRMWRAAGTMEMLAFAPLALVRTVARSWGLLRGMWHFRFRGAEDENGRIFRKNR